MVISKWQSVTFKVFGYWLKTGIDCFSLTVLSAKNIHWRQRYCNFIAEFTQDQLSTKKSPTKNIIFGFIPHCGINDSKKNEMKSSS